MVNATRSHIAVRTLAAGVLFCGAASIAIGADGDATRGEARAVELFCTVCHGPAGNSVTPEWPALAGQDAGYLAEQLALFRPRERSNTEMTPLAATLTDTDIVDLAAYFAAQTPTPAAPPSQSAAQGDDQTAVARLYAEGDAARGLAACASCHGKTGRGGEMDHSDAARRGPALQGQQAVYVTKQLKDYAARSRYTSNGAAAEQMSVLSAKLTAEEMSALGTWLQRLR